MRTDRRLWRLVIIAAVVAAPAVVLQVFCVGNACDEKALATPAVVPFCPLPAEIRQLVSDGYYVSRSPDLFAITRASNVNGNDPADPTGAALSWPSLEAPASTRVPIVFAGPGAGPPPRADATGLRDVGPTVASMIGFKTWPFPTERSGTSAVGPHVPDPARLGLIIAWKGIGSDDLEAAPSSWPFLKTSLLKNGTGTLDGRTGSLPVDSTAGLTTIGTGSLPSKHGVTGTLVRNEVGKLVDAWGPGSEVAVINALGDGLDETSGGRALVGLAGTEPFDRGVIGGNWFLGSRDDDDVRIVDPGRVAATATQMLDKGYGDDDVPDLLAVTLEGDPASMDRATRTIVTQAEAATGGSVAVAVVGTGSDSAPGAAAKPRNITAADVSASIDEAVDAPVVEATVPGAVFLDQPLIAKDALSQSEMLGAARATETAGEPVFADVFPAYAISFGRYC